MHELRIFTGVKDTYSQELGQLHTRSPSEYNSSTAATQSTTTRISSYSFSIDTAPIHGIFPIADIVQIFYPPSDTDPQNCPTLGTQLVNHKKVDLRFFSYSNFL